MMWGIFSHQDFRWWEGLLLLLTSRRHHFDCCLPFNFCRWHHQWEQRQRRTLCTNRPDRWERVGTHSIQCCPSSLLFLSSKSCVCRHTGIAYVRSRPLGVQAFTIYGACVCFTVCVFYTVVEKDDPLAGGLYIPCPDHYKNYCVHGDCQFPNILAQPSCRYTQIGTWRNLRNNPFWNTKTSNDLAATSLFNFWDSKPTTRVNQSYTVSLQQSFLSHWGENCCYLSYEVDKSF